MTVVLYLASSLLSDLLTSEEDKPIMKGGFGGKSQVVGAGMVIGSLRRFT